MNAATAAHEAAVYQEDATRDQRVIAEVEGRAGDMAQPIEEGLEFRTFSGRRAVVVSVFPEYANVQVYIGPRRSKVTAMQLEHIRECLHRNAVAQGDL